ncbi:MAG TPA: Gfo/Idh/MocA family oxidoreductase [Phycisphaerae bacterium]|nr:Gfo/Idh/MocA family oxidoreductase [Phycisphaerae bacterium]HPS52185.1 Gfo/Idh/MocA family oxidoreductase [Phycisphaerae bacterium]
MSDSRIPVAVIGLGAFGQRTLKALQQCDNVEVVAVADKLSDVAQNVATDAGVEGYTDNRQMILKKKPLAVFVATPPMAWGELLGFCAQNGVHVWKEAPLARNLGEAVNFVRMFEKAGLKLAVGTQRRFSQSYRKLAESKLSIGDVFLARAHYLFNWGSQLNWRADRVSAGGGALLEVGYHPIDLLIWTLGLPEEVYGANMIARKRNLLDETQGIAGSIHDTDDTASATLKYKDDTMAAVVTSRITGPASEEFSLHGRGGSIVANFETCRLRNPDGDVLDYFESKEPPHEIYVRQVQNFLNSINEGVLHYECSAAENLLTHAVIDAIYLSCQTAQPESPLEQLRIHGMTPRQCLKFSASALAVEEK